MIKFVAYSLFDLVGIGFFLWTSYFLAHLIVGAA